MPEIVTPTQTVRTMMMGKKMSVAALAGVTVALFATTITLTGICVCVHEHATSSRFGVLSSLCVV